MTEEKEIVPSELYDALVEDLAKHNESTALFVKSFTFYGKSLSDHSKDFYIEVPDKVTPEEFRAIFIKIINRIQMAQHYYSIANSIYTTLNTGSAKKKADLVAVITQKYEDNQRKRPAADVIKSIADSYISSTNNVLTAAKIIKDFWREKLDGLIEVRKCMEQIGISQATELKHLN